MAKNVQNTAKLENADRGQALLQMQTLPPTFGCFYEEYSYKFLL